MWFSNGSGVTEKRRVAPTLQCRIPCPLNIIRCLRLEYLLRFDKRVHVANGTIVPYRRCRYKLVSAMEDGTFWKRGIQYGGAGGSKHCFNGNINPQTPMRNVVKQTFSIVHVRAVIFHICFRRPSLDLRLRLKNPSSSVESGSSSLSLSLCVNSDIA